MIFIETLIKTVNLIIVMYIDTINSSLFRIEFILE